MKTEPDHIANRRISEIIVTLHGRRYLNDSGYVEKHRLTIDESSPGYTLTDIAAETIAAVAGISKIPAELLDGFSFLFVTPDLPPDVLENSDIFGME